MGATGSELMHTFFLAFDSFCKKLPMGKLVPSQPELWTPGIVSFLIPPNLNQFNGWAEIVSQVG
jgi:hypothetical protein